MSTYYIEASASLDPRSPCQSQVVLAAVVVACVVLDEICLALLEVTFVRLALRTLDRGIKSATFVRTRATSILARRIGASPDAANRHSAGQQPEQQRHPRENLRKKKDYALPEHQQRAPALLLELSEENLLAHEKALACRGDVWHDWHAVREHTQHCQSRKTCSRTLSASPTFRAYSPRAQVEPREQADKLAYNIFSTACPSISEIRVERHRDRVVPSRRGKQQETNRQETRYAVPITPADIMARWNLGRTPQHMTLAV